MATDSGADRALVASDQARSGLAPSGFDHGYWREPAIHSKRDGKLFLASDGKAFFLDFWWFEGAKIAYASAILKGFLAYWLWRSLPDRLAFAKPGMALLPSAGDWIYREQHGRCSSLAMFIDCDLKRRATQSTGDPQ